MTREDILKRMDRAFREDRERFFAIADSLALQPKYAEHSDEIEEVKQEWRDAPQLEGYPNIDHPLKLPEWFPKVPFASSWKKDIYLQNKLKESTQNKRCKL